MRAIISALIILVISNCGVFSLQLNQFPPFKGIYSTPYSNITEDISPEIEDVSIVPLKPKEGDLVTVSAKIFNNPKKTENIVISATLYYSTDKINWHEVPMEQDEKDTTIYTAKIPPHGSGEKVVFYITAQDSVGNTVVEVPQLENQENLESGWTLLIKDEDDKGDIVHNSLDIISTYLSYDDGWIYLKMETQDKITPGTTHNPPFLHIYGFGLLNPEISEDILEGYLVFYAPHFKLGGYPEALFYSLGQMDFIYKADTSAEISKNILTLKFRKSFIGNKPLYKLKIIAGTCGLTDINLRRGASAGGVSVIEYLQNKVLELRGTSSVTSDMVNNILKYITPVDATGHTTVYLRSHTYTVE